MRGQRRGGILAAATTAAPTCEKHTPGDTPSMAWILYGHMHKRIYTGTALARECGETAQRMQAHNEQAMSKL